MGVYTGVYKDNYSLPSIQNLYLGLFLKPYKWLCIGVYTGVYAGICVGAYVGVCTDIYRDICRDIRGTIKLYCG